MLAQLHLDTFYGQLHHLQDQNQKGKIYRSVAIDRTVDEKFNISVGGFYSLIENQANGKRSFAGYRAGPEIKIRNKGGSLNPYFKAHLLSGYYRLDPIVEEDETPCLEETEEDSCKNQNKIHNVGMGGGFGVELFSLTGIDFLTELLFEKWSKRGDVAKNFFSTRDHFSRIVTVGLQLEL